MVDYLNQPTIEIWTSNPKGHEDPSPYCGPPGGRPFNKHPVKINHGSHLAMRRSASVIRLILVAWIPPMCCHNFTTPANI